MLVALALLHADLTSDLNSILADAKLNGAIVAVTVQDADGKVLYERNPEVRLLPASNEKLFSCAFALHELGTTFRPTTFFWQTSKALIVRANGDPTMSLHTLRLLAKQLNPKRKPIWLSEAYKPGYEEGWELGDLPNRYSAPVYALTVDRGSLELWSHEGTLQFRPAQFDISVAWNGHQGPFTDRFDVITHRLTVHGTMPSEETRLDTLGIPNTDIEAARVLGNGFRYVDTTPSRKPDFVQFGDPILKTMQTCLQMSDNNLAENFLLLGASKGATLDDAYGVAIPRLARFLHDDVGLTPAQSTPSDGSGLGRHNWQTVTGIAQLLRWCLKQPTGPVWRTLLDHPGSGTLKKRLSGVLFQGKTGTSSGVSALSGYIATKQGPRVVSIIENNFTCNSSEAKAIEDEVVRKIAADTTDGTQHAD